MNAALTTPVFWGNTEYRRLPQQPKRPVNPPRFFSSSTVSPALLGYEPIKARSPHATLTRLTKTGPPVMYVPLFLLLIGLLEFFYLLYF